jgi:amidophosphoribosyltransferase
MTRAEITKYLGADSLGYLDVDGMVRACGIPAKKFCMACFTGDYPVAFAPGDNNKEILEQRRERSVSLVPEEESRQRFLL